MFLPLREASAIGALVMLALASVQGLEKISLRFDRQRASGATPIEPFLNDAIPHNDQELTQRWDDSLRCSAFMYRTPAWSEVEKLTIHPHEAL